MSDIDLNESLAAVASPPVYTGDVMVDRLYDMVLRLTQELAVTREEVALLRSSLLQNSSLDTAGLDAIAQSQEFAGQQLESHKALIQQVLGDLPAADGVK